MSKVLLSQTGTVGAGQIQTFQSTNNVRVVQFNPKVGNGFSGSMVIEGSYAANPGNNDFQTMVALTFTAATQNFSIDIESTAPFVRARIVTSTNGAISVSGTARSGSISGSQGASPASIMIDSSLKVAGTGSGFLINSPVVPSITTDDVFLSTDISKSLTTALVERQAKIGTGVITASEADLNLLAGQAGGGLESADLTKLAAITAGAADINKLTSLTATTTELNKLAGTSVTKADLEKIAGLAGTSVGTTQLAYLSGLSQNVQTTLASIPSLVGLDSTVGDLNLLKGASTGSTPYTGALTSAHLNYLVGVTSNVQTQLNAKRSTSATIGISEITSSAISITELNYLSGASGNIQSQINAMAFSGTYGSGTFAGPLYSANGSASTPGVAFASAHTTGMYLNGSAIGFAVGGTAFAKLSATALTIGDGVSNGTPSIRGTGYGAANPVYAFVGDLGTGMYWVSAGKIGFSGAGRVLATIDGNTTPGVITLGTASDNTAVNIAGIFSGEKMLSKTVVPAGKNPAIAVGAGNEVSLYTVPTGRTCIVTRAAIVINTATQGGSGGVISQFRMDLGNLNATCKELLDNVSNTTVFNPGGSYSFNTAGQILWLGTGDNPWQAIAGSNGNSYAVFAAGTVLAARPQARADFDVWAISVILFGYEY